MSFVGLYIGLSGVRAAQAGIDVASNNVANASTPGYTRQRVELAASPSWRAPFGQMGNGVTITSVNRLRDAFVDARARAALSDAGATGVRAEVLTSLERLTGEPDAGITVRLDALWTAAEAWANDPADTASRRQVLSELSALGSTFRSVSGQWDTLAANVAVDRDTQIAEANRSLDALAELDRLIHQAGGRVGNDLFDQRDLLLDEIAHLTGATTRIGADGRSEVLLGGVNLVSPTGAGALQLSGSGGVEAVAPDGTVFDASPLLGGRIGGLTQALQHDLPAWRSELDQLAATIADAINAVNSGGVLADGSAGGPLITYDPTNAAATLALVSQDPSVLAAAVSGSPPEPFDASNARLFADLRTAVVPDALGGNGRIGDRLADLLTAIAGDVRAARTADEQSRAVASSALLGRQAQHGVSLDEEMVSLVQHQRALEAATRVMTAIDEALDTLVNRIGVVGR